MVNRFTDAVHGTFHRADGMSAPTDRILTVPARALPRRRVR